MRYLGTLMLLASVVMLLFPSFWEGREHAGPDGEQAEKAPFEGRSTLRKEDLIPEWRGPPPRSDQNARGDQNG
jgi:hypothetical protein